MSELPPSQELPFNKKDACVNIDDAVGEMYERYQTDIPAEIEEFGEEVRNTADSIAGSSKVNTKEEFIAALDFKKKQGLITDKVYEFIINKI